MNEELKSIIKSVESVVKLAYNVKPREHKNIGKTRAETDKIINEAVSMIQSKLIAFYALQAAVKLSPDNEAISAKAVEIIDYTIAELGVQIQ